MSAGPFKIATVLLMAALPVALFGAIEHGEARVAQHSPRTALPDAATGQVEGAGADPASVSDSQKPVVGECLVVGGAMPSCNSPAPVPSRDYREVWAGVADLGDSR